MKTSGGQSSSPHVIRVFGDPVLKIRCPEVTEIDSALVKLSEDMVQTMRAANGVGLAAPQIGVQKRMFVYDEGYGPETIINPEIIESEGEWTLDEGCLSVPGQYFSITRAERIVLTGQDLEGGDVHIEAREFLAKIFQHELDHLNGILLLERLTPDQRKQAMRTLRQNAIG